MMYEAANKAPERTSPQVYAEPGPASDADLSPKLTANYKVYRDMRYDPTIAFVRMLTVSPLVLAGWSYEDEPGAPTGAKEFIEKTFEPLRSRLVKTAAEGYIDYGWAGYEVVHAYDDDSGCITICKLKHLLQDYTTILVDPDCGEWIGLRQDQGYCFEPVDLNTFDSLLITFDVEGTYWYGVPLMENARRPYLSWNEVDKSASRYDKRIAGSHWVVYYPIGTSPVSGEGEVDNFVLAKRILASLESSGRIAIPTKVTNFVEDLNQHAKDNGGWKIELLSDQGKGTTSFIERMKYLDALKCRAFGIPERAVLEGQFGTKAESETQADFAISNIELRHNLITESINKGPVDNLMVLNYGRASKGKIKIKPTPLSDDKKAYLRKLYEAFIADPNVMMEESSQVDMDTIRTSLNIPTRMQNVVPQLLMPDPGTDPSLLGQPQFDEYGNPIVADMYPGEQLLLPAVDPTAPIAMAFGFKL